MMDARSAGLLRDLVQRYGTVIVEDPRRLRGLLADMMPDARRETAVLLAAVEEGIPADLMDRASVTPTPALQRQLEKRLIENRGLATDSARWAVDTWAAALGVGAGVELERARSPRVATGESTVSVGQSVQPRADGPESPAIRGAWKACVVVLLLVNAVWPALLLVTFVQYGDLAPLIREFFLPLGWTVALAIGEVAAAIGFVRGRSWATPVAFWAAVIGSVGFFFPPAFAPYLPASKTVGSGWLIPWATQVVLLAVLIFRLVRSRQASSSSMGGAGASS